MVSCSILTLNSVGFSVLTPTFRKRQYHKSRGNSAQILPCSLILMLTLQSCLSDMFCVSFPSSLVLLLQLWALAEKLFVLCLKVQRGGVQWLPQQFKQLFKGSMVQVFVPASQSIGFVWSLRNMPRKIWNPYILSKQIVTAKIQCNAEKLKQTITVIDLYTFLKLFCINTKVLAWPSHTDGYLLSTEHYRRHVETSIINLLYSTFFGTFISVTFITLLEVW